MTKGKKEVEALQPCDDSTQTRSWSAVIQPAQEKMIQWSLYTHFILYMMDGLVVPLYTLPRTNLQKKTGFE